MSVNRHIWVHQGQTELELQIGCGCLNNHRFALWQGHVFALIPDVLLGMKK